MENIKEETFKPTLKKPVNKQSQNFEKNFKKTMTQFNPNMKLNETDAMLSEAEQSLKKKIFSLAKMEALVFSDPKLSAVYDEMSVNGEEKYGYHYNETIMNMLFNDYVLNSPKYLQKYKMAIPKKKKRRDQSGINQLRKAGEEKMQQSGLPKSADKSEKKPEKKLAPSGLPKDDNVEETTGSASSGAYVGAAAWKKGGDLMEEPKVVDETTSASSAGGAAGYVGYAGPAAWGSGDLMKTKGKAPVMRKPIFPGGTIIQESNYLIDSTGFEKFIEMLNEEDLSYQIELGQQYKQTHTDSNNGLGVRELPKGEKHDELRADIDKNTELYVGQDVDRMPEKDVEILHHDMVEPHSMFPHPENPVLPDDGISGANIVNQEKSKTKPFVSVQNPAREKADDLIIDKTTAFTSDAVKNWGDDDTRLELDTIKNGAPDKQNINLMETNINEKSVSKKQQRFMGMVHALQKGELKPSEVGDKVEKAAASMTKKDAEDFASTKHKGLPEKIDEFLSLHDTVEYVSDREGENPFDMHGVKWQFVNAKYPDGKVDIGVYRFGHDLVYDYARWREEMGINENNNIKEDTQTMIQNNGTSMSNKATPAGDQSSNMDMGARSSGGMSEALELESANKLLEELNNELEAFSIHQNKLKKMSEDRKPSSLVLKDRLGNDNEANFKKDLQQSGTKEVIDVEKELQWKDQQTNVGDDPQKLAQDIENAEIKATDAKGDEALKNVGDSTNDKGDEIPKRNLKDKEQHEVDMYRNGQHSWVYDNEPDKRFEDRMKADMGDDIYKMRQEQMKFRAKAPMYNKDTQPVEDGIEKVQFDKEKSGWNEREGLKESMITGRYQDVLNKRRLIDFTLNEVKIVDKVDENTFELDFTGLGNTYNSKTQDYKVSVNETVVNVLASHKFFTNGKEVFAVKNPVQKLNENEQKDKPVVNEQVNKMKHLLGYKPDDFVNTKNVKKNRGF